LTVTVADVRTFLKDLPSEFVSDSTIQKQIDVATFIVDKEKSEAATTSDVDNAVLLQAAHLTLCAYAFEVERSLGVVSPSLNALIELLRRNSEDAMKYIKRGKTVKPPAVIVSDSLWEYMRKYY